MERPCVCLGTGGHFECLSPARHKGFNIFTEWSSLRPAFTHTNTENPTAAVETMTDSISQRQTASRGGVGGAKESEKERKRENSGKWVSVSYWFQSLVKTILSFLLLSGLSFAAWKINPERSSWAAGLVHSSRALWANFPAQRANSVCVWERKRRWDRKKGRERDDDEGNLGKFLLLSLWSSGVCECVCRSDACRAAVAWNQHRSIRSDAPAHAKEFNPGNQIPPGPVPFIKHEPESYQISKQKWHV